MKKIKFLIAILILGLARLNAQTLNDGILQMENENYSAAEKTFNQLATAQPKNSEVLYYLGETYYRMEKFDLAKAKYDAGLLLSNKSFQNQIGLGKLFLDKGNLKEAEKAFSTSLRMTKSKDPRAYALIGQSYLESQKPNAEKAVENLTKARDLETKNPKWFIMLGDAYVAKKDAGNAMTNYEFAEAKDKNNAEIYMKKARIWAKTSLVDEAIKNLEQCIKIAPNYALAYKDLVELYVQKRDYTKVTGLLEKYISLAGNDFDAKERLVKFLTFQAKDYDRAISEGNAALKQKPDLIKMHRWLAWANYEKAMIVNIETNAADRTNLMNQSYNASQSLINGLKNSTTSKLFDFDYLYLIKSTAALGKTKETESAIVELGKIDPTKTCTAYGDLAKMYYDNKMYVEAYNGYKAKITNCAKAEDNDYYYQGFSAFRAKMYKECDTAFTKYSEKVPKVYDGYYWRAKAQNELDDSNNPTYIAKPMYEKVIEIIGTNISERNKRGLIDAYIYMAYYHAGSNDFANANVYCDKVLTLDATNPTAVSLKGQIQGK